MSVYSPETRNFWQSIANEASAQRPSVGKSVEIVKGRKHKGKSGIVVWHGVNQFSDAFRYCDSARLALAEINGREGYSVKVKMEDGNTFFVPAEYTLVK